MEQFSQKMDWATFWATFSQTNLVTLVPNPSNRSTEGFPERLDSPDDD
jgi:hypothetical protein